MNEKYLAKYLPVKEEIKKGDSYYFKDEPDNILVRTGDRTVSSMQKVKLFLCSRDIQVGDTFQSFSGMCELQWDGKFQLHPEDYKIIGEISPAATWVKEGDEFDGYKEIFFHNVEGEWKLNDGIRWSSYPIERFISVKGPCGYYH